MPLAVALLAAVVAVPASAAPIAVTTTADDTDTNGNCTLREAVIAANTDAPRDACAAGSGADVITLGGGLYQFSAGLQTAGEDFAATGDLDLRGPLAITGAGAASTTIDANHYDRVFDVAAGNGPIRLAGMRIVHGMPGASGGGILGHSATVTLDGVALEDNTGTSGGGISTLGPLTVRDSTLSGNDGGTGGGGASVADGGAVFTNTLVSTNQADRGAGIFANGPLAMTGGEVTGNGDTTTNQGGGIEADGALSLTAIRIDHNTVFNIGGGLFADIRNNEAGQLDRVEIDHNGATSSGMNLTQAGGIASQGHLDIVDSYVHDNTTIPGGINGLGGGIWFQPRNNNGVPEPLTITGSTISANTSGGGDGIDLAGASTPSTATITRSTVSGNGQDTAAGAGGGIFVGARQTATLRDVTLAENKSSNGTPAGGNLEVGGQGTANLVNTLVARPFGGGDCEVQASGALHPQGGNAEYNSVHTCGLESSGDDLSPADLGELADNGGPTPTHAVGPSSPLLGLGGAFCQPTDQRGAPRPQDSGCEPGAYEFDDTPPVATIDSGPSGTVGDASPTFAFSANENATFRCTLDGSAPRVCSSPLTVGPLGDGPHIFTVRPTDVSGNQGADVTRSFTVATAATGGGGNAGSGGGGQAGGAPQTGPSASGSSGTAAAPGPGPVAGAAAVTALGIRPRAFRAAARGGSVAAAKRGAIVSFSTSAPGTVTFTVQRPSRKRKGHKRRLKRLRGAFTRPATGGANSFRFTGRVAGKALKPGAYRLVATGPGGARTTAFRIIG